MEIIIQFSILPFICCKSYSVLIEKATIPINKKATYIYPRICPFLPQLSLKSTVIPLRLPPIKVEKRKESRQIFVFVPFFCSDSVHSHNNERNEMNEFRYLPIPKACVSPILRDRHVSDLKIRICISCNSIMQNAIDLKQA